MKEIFSVYDKKAGHYSPPFCSENVQVLKRQLAIEVQRPDSMIGKFPTDYEVYSLGFFDEPSGSITVSKNPEFRFNMFELIPEPTDVAPVGKEVAANE